MLKKLFRKVWIVMGEWPFPPQITVRSKPNSRFTVGLKADFLDVHPGVAGIDDVHIGRGLATYAG